MSNYVFLRKVFLALPASTQRYIQRILKINQDANYRMLGDTLYDNIPKNIDIDDIPNILQYVYSNWCLVTYETTFDNDFNDKPYLTGYPSTTHTLDKKIHVSFITYTGVNHSYFHKAFIINFMINNTIILRIIPEIENEDFIIRVVFESKLEANREFLRIKAVNTNWPNLDYRNKKISLYQNCNKFKIIKNNSKNFSSMEITLINLLFNKLMIVVNKRIKTIERRNNKNKDDMISILLKDKKILNSIE